MKHSIKMVVNGEDYELVVNPNELLIDVLRDRLDLTGTKEGCGTGDCGACTVLVDGKAINSCLTLAIEMNDKEIFTIEGMAPGGKLNPIQEAFIDEGAVQCGFCTPGMILSAKALLQEKRLPSEDEIKNLCRCTGYKKIIQAIQTASLRLGKESNATAGQSREACLRSAPQQGTCLSSE
jgi:carbon-monoxide dehydrogenase small subunit